MGEQKNLILLFLTGAHWPVGAWLFLNHIGEEVYFAGACLDNTDQSAAWKLFSSDRHQR